MVLLLVLLGLFWAPSVILREPVERLDNWSVELCLVTIDRRTLLSVVSKEESFLILSCVDGWIKVDVLGRCSLIDCDSGVSATSSDSSAQLLFATAVLSIGRLAAYGLLEIPPCIGIDLNSNFLWFCYWELFVKVAAATPLPIPVDC